MKINKIFINKCPLCVTISTIFGFFLMCSFVSYASNGEGGSFVFLDSPVFQEIYFEPNEPNFFGTYYGSFSTQIGIKYKVKYLFWWSGVKIKYIPIEVKDIKLHLDYDYTSDGGFFDGRGEGTFEGNIIPIAVNGKVVSKGKGWGMASMMLPKFRTDWGHCLLSSDGLQLTIPIMGHNITLRKDAGPNTPPKVKINSPPPAINQSLEYGQSYAFSATVNDAQQKTIPDERLVWKSDRDGIFYDRGLIVSKKNLTPGKHIITFEATDDGGLKGSDSISITVVNQPPEKPEIILPYENAQLYNMTPIIFQGKCYDLEDGWLTKNNLKWSSNIDGYMGSGDTLTTFLKTPGTHVIRLTATDSIGTVNYSERVISISKYTGNSPPQVIIIEPKHLSNAGIAIQSGKEMTFQGTVTDVEDSFDKLKLEWRISNTLESGKMTEKVFGSGEKATYKLVASDVPIVYTIILIAKDSGGLEGKASIKIVVMPWTIE